MFDIAYQLRSQLARYLAEEIPLAEFVEWFLSRCWSLNREEELAAGDLVREIELRLAEHSNGDLTDDELHEQFTHLLAKYSVVVGREHGAHLTETSTSSPVASASARFLHPAEAGPIIGRWVRKTS